MICTFFGHRDIPEGVSIPLYKVLSELIKQYPSIRFYVGNSGGFDRAVIRALQQLQKDFPSISYAVVLAYLPQKQEAFGDTYPTLFPEGLERTPPRFAIDKRNRWMLKSANIVITYVKYPFGGAANYKAIAKQQHKTIIELSEI